MNITSILWRMLDAYVQSEPSSNWIRVLSNKPLFFHTNILHDVSHLDFDISVPYTLTDENLYFHNLNDLLQALHTIYAYQEDSTHKSLVQQAYSRWIHHKSVLDITSHLSSLCCVASTSDH